MHQRIDMFKSAPDAYKAVLALENYVQGCGLDRRLVHLIKLRASQINGCAFCVDMHVKEARRDGLSEQWLNLLCVWQESPIYDARERALLAWTEAVTRLPQTGAPDADFAPLREHFSDEDRQADGCHRDHQSLEPAGGGLPLPASGRRPGACRLAGAGRAACAIAARGQFPYISRMASRDVARLAEGGLIVLHDHARLPARFFGRFTAAILADLRRFG